jgi:hypothetical protein
LKQIGVKKTSGMAKFLLKAVLQKMKDRKGHDSITAIHKPIQRINAHSFDIIRLCGIG